MSLDQKDLELIERVIYKNGDDVAVSIARSLERLEERIDATESRLYRRLAGLEETIDTSRQALADELGDVRGEVREIAYPRDNAELKDTLDSRTDEDSADE